LKGAWLRHVTHFGGDIHISGIPEAIELSHFVLVVYTKRMKNQLLWVSLKSFLRFETFVIPISVISNARLNGVIN